MRYIPPIGKYDDDDDDDEILINCTMIIDNKNALSLKETSTKCITV